MIHSIQLNDAKINLSTRPEHDQLSDWPTSRDSSLISGIHCSS